MTATVAPTLEATEHDRSRRYELIGLGSMVACGGLLVLIGAGLVSGALRLVGTVLLLATIAGFVVVAVSGGPEARRRRAPYGLLMPGVCRLAMLCLPPQSRLL